MERLTWRSENGKAEWDYGFKDDLVAEKLAAYEDAAEQGRLVVLPCKVGDVIYEIVHIHKCAGCPDNQCLPVEKCKLYAGQCSRVDEWKIIPGNFSINDFSLYTMKLKRNLFLTRAEAESALKAGEADA